LIEVNNNR